MIALKRFFASPVFDDAEKTRAAEALNTILLTVLGLGFVATLGLMLGAISTPLIYAQRLIVLLFTLALKVALNRGYVKRVGVALVAGITVLTTLALSVNGTVRSPATGVYILVSIIAGLAISLQAAYWSAAVNILLVAGLVYGETHGLFPPPANKTNIQQVIVFASIAAGTATLITQALHKIQDALQRAYQNEREVRSLAESLERRVSARTAEAEAARRAAEISAAQAQSARQDLERQLWLADGQSQVAEAIRGEQSLQQLAAHVLQRICKYVDAQAGAVYLLDGAQLNMMGGYAYPARAGFDGRLPLGEGLVGQAAADGKALSAEMPSGTLILSTSIADITPRQVVAAPFSMNGRIVGVLELVTLSKFTEIHFALWQHISETLGAAFQAAQTRARLAELLTESQRQAEELQAQEEELRAANEELLAQAEGMKARQA